MSMQEEEYARLLRKPEGAAGIEVALTMNRLNAYMYRHCFELLPHGPVHILETGPGNASEAVSLLQTRSDIHYTGIDYSPDMVSEGSNRLKVFAERAQYVRGNAAQLPFPPEYFDVLLSINTLYFMEDPGTTLQSWQRVLKPGGMMLIGLRSRESMEQRGMQHHGFRLFEADELLRLMQHAGLEQCSSSTIQEAPHLIGNQNLPMQSFVCMGLK